MLWTHPGPFESRFRPAPVPDWLRQSDGDGCFAGSLSLGSHPFVQSPVVMHACHRQSRCPDQRGIIAQSRDTR